MEGWRILSLLANKEELLLVHWDMPYISRAKRYDLMLTPQLYIFKKEKLPIKYLYQAKKLAPSILDELTDDGDYSYTAIKEADEWILIAYDMVKIEKFLESRGLPANQINKIYFAQQSKDNFKMPVEVDDKNAIVTVDNTVVVLPKTIVDTEEFAIVTDQFRPEKGVSPAQNRNSFIGQKQAIIISVMLVLFSVGYIAEGVRYQNTLNTLEEKVEHTKSKYPALKNKADMVLNNIYQSNYDIDTLQRKIRNRLKDISRLTSKDSKIDILKIDAKGYEATITADAKSIKDLRKHAKAKSLIAKDANGKLMLKGAL